MKGHKREFDSHSAFPHVSPAAVVTMIPSTVTTVQLTGKYVNIELSTLHSPFALLYVDVVLRIQQLYSTMILAMPTFKLNLQVSMPTVSPSAIAISIIHNTGAVHVHWNLKLLFMIVHSFIMHTSEQKFPFFRLVNEL